MNQIRKLIQVKNQPAQEKKKKGTTRYWHDKELAQLQKQNVVAQGGMEYTVVWEGNPNAWNPHYRWMPGGRGNDRVSVSIKFCLYELRVVLSTRDMKETISDPQIYGSRNLC